MCPETENKVFHNNFNRKKNSSKQWQCQKIHSKKCFLVEKCHIGLNATLTFSVPTLWNYTIWEHLDLHSRISQYCSECWTYCSSRVGSHPGICQDETIIHLPSPSHLCHNCQLLLLLPLGVATMIIMAILLLLCAIHVFLCHWLLWQSQSFFKLPAISCITTTTTTTTKNHSHL